MVRLQVWASLGGFFFFCICWTTLSIQGDELFTPVNESHDNINVLQLWAWWVALVWGPLSEENPAWTKEDWDLEEWGGEEGENEHLLSSNFMPGITVGAWLSLFPFILATTQSFNKYSLSARHHNRCWGYQIKQITGPALLSKMKKGNKQSGSRRSLWCYFDVSSHRQRIYGTQAEMVPTVFKVSV